MYVRLCFSVCHQVKVLWVFNAQQTNWEKQLPAETQALLDRRRAKKGGLFARKERQKQAVTVSKL
jgi:hypothetical protein